MTTVSSGTSNSKTHLPLFDSFHSSLRYLQTRFIEHSINSPKQSVWERIAPLFSLTSLKLESFILPVLYGSMSSSGILSDVSMPHSAVDIRSESINSCNFQLVLISRRSRFRAGTRYFRRGIDHEGHVANYNETEQILVLHADKETKEDVKQSLPTFVSFVQTRGSVPVYWAEINNLRYKPDIQVMELNHTVSDSRQLAFSFSLFARLLQSGIIFTNNCLYMVPRL